MNKLQPAFMMRKSIGSDKQGYLDTLDKSTVAGLQTIIDSGQDQPSVMRLFFGSTTEMPVRAITYVLSAIRAAKLLPISQLQIIGTPCLGNRVNGVPISESIEQFKKMAALSRHILSKTDAGVLDSTIFAIDDPTNNTKQFEHAVAEVLESSPEMRNIIMQKGHKRGADAVAYTAAHIAFQETGLLKLEQILDGPETIEPTSIISVGAQSERPFFAVRSLVRPLIVDEIDLLPSVQVFTKHVVPPYFMARGGEQSLDDAISTRQINTEPTDVAARRDMRHFADFLTKGVLHHA